jgi:hypothetical protein
MRVTNQVEPGPAPLKAKEIELSLDISEGFAPWPFFAEDEIEVAAQVLRSGKPHLHCFGKLCGDVRRQTGYG